MGKETERSFVHDRAVDKQVKLVVLDMQTVKGMFSGPYSSALAAKA